MAANAANRETVRDALTTLLSTALTGIGNPVQSVYGYHVSEFGGEGFESPVVLVLSSGSQRERRGLGNQKYRTFFQLEILVFVSDAISAESWTDANVEDRLDLIEKEIADVIAENRSSPGVWDDLKHVPGNYTNIVPAKLGGHSYKMETIPVIVEVQDA